MLLCHCSRPDSTFLSDRIGAHSHHAFQVCPVLFYFKHRQRSKARTMFDFVQDIGLDLYPVLVHCAVAGLFLSCGLTRQTRVRISKSHNEASWIMLVAGTAASIPSRVTGLIAHSLYEERTLAVAIKPHQFWGLLGRLVVPAVLVWRFFGTAAGTGYSHKPCLPGDRCLRTHLDCPVG